MNRRDFLKTGLTSAALPLLGAQTHQAKRPNVLFIMDDQHRGDCLGADGARWMDTPNLDRLAREGIRFTKAYTSLPSCYPARASLLTGMSPWGHGLLLYAPMAERYEHEMPRMFTDAGYRTHAVGKMHFDSNDHGFESIALEEAWRAVNKENVKCDYRKWFEANHPGKDVDATGLGYTDHRGGRYYPYDDELHPTYWTAQQAVDFLDAYREDRPWFLKCSFQRPHPPFDPPKRLLDRYLKRDLPNAQVGAWAKDAYGAVSGSLEETPNAPRGHFPPDEIRRARATYYAAITFVDEQIGRVVDALKRRGELENTIILFTADHGDMMGDHHLWRKTYAYEGSARVPMIVRWPDSIPVNGAKRGMVSDRLVELRDVLPTFLDAAALDKPGAMEGMSMLDIVRNDADSWRTVLDLEHGECYWHECAWVALTDGTEKYIYFTRTGQQQLFNVADDPYEWHDRSADFEHSVKQWRERMINHLSVRGEPWIRNGDLATFSETIRYAPHHPSRA